MTHPLMERGHLQKIARARNAYMSEDHTSPPSPNRTHIIVRERHELRYWCGVFAVSPEQLREAVQIVGPNPRDVKRFLVDRDGVGGDSDL